MARGRDEFYGRRADVAQLGRAISRRARNSCELCGDKTSLQVIEVEPVFEEPVIDRALMVCERCQQALVGKRRRIEPTELHFLAQAVWSETLPAQLTAVRLTRELSERGVGWATEILEGLYLDPETEALLES